MALRKCSFGVALMFTGVSLAGCASSLFNPYEGVPTGAYKFGNAPFTLADLKAQDAARDGCFRWADETNPSDAALMKAFFANNALGGLIGGSTGTAAAGAILAYPVTLAPVAAGGVSYMLGAGFVGAASGHIYHGVLVHADMKYCLLATTYGLHFIAPSDVQKLRDGQVAEIRFDQLPTNVATAAANFLPPPFPPAP